VISISPDKAGPPVTGRGLTRNEVPRSGLAAHAKDGETLAGIGPVFRQKFTINAGNYRFRATKKTNEGRKSSETGSAGYGPDQLIWTEDREKGKWQHG
jgi:hypothetical protein